MSGVLAPLKSLLKHVKAPWAYTGPVTSPDYVTHLTKPTVYRKFAPTTPPHAPIIPQAEPDHVYNIEYYTRDSRRAHMPGGPVENVRSEYDVTAPDASLEAVKGPITPGTTYRWKANRPITEQDNNGWTI